MNIEYQLQIDAVKGERIFYKQYDKLILLTDGHIGVYLTEKELKIDKSKMIEINETKDSISLNPENLLRERTAAHETRIARKTFPRGFAIKIQSKESEEYCFVQERFLKMFKGYDSLFIKSLKEPILVRKYGVPYGFIMPVFLSGQEGE